MLTVLALVGIASANLLYNGDLTIADPGDPLIADGWSEYNSGGWVNREVNANGTYGDPSNFHYAIGNAGAINNGAYQDVAGTAGLSYVLTADMAMDDWWKPDGFIKIEFYEAAGTAPENLLAFAETWIYANGYDGAVAQPWANQSVTATAPVGTATVRTVLGSWTASDGGTVRFDNAVLKLGTEASNPDPADDAVLPSNTVSSLSWTNPDPLNGTDALTISVKFDIEPGVGIYDPNDNNVSTGGGTDIETIALSTMTNPPTSPLPDGYYSWQVIVTDPNTTGGGVPVVTQGPVWLFEVGDAAPVVGQPVNQYMWLSQDDSAIPGGDGPSNVRYFQVTASYTDDGKSAIVDANFVNHNWGWDPLGPDGTLSTGDEERGITEVSDVHTPGVGGGSVTAIYKTEYNAADPNYSTDIMGYWNISLEVTDGTGTVAGVAGHHEIWDTCGEAATSDPDDTFDGTYDVDQNCKNDIVDFAAFAAVWLDQSVTYE